MLSERRLRDFTFAYQALGDLLTRIRHSIGTAPVVYRTPPGQITVPRNPDYTGGSDTSSSSAESKPEPHVNIFGNLFLGAAFLTVSKWIQTIRWVNPQARAHFKSQYVLSFLSDLVLSNLWACASAPHNTSRHKMMAACPCVFSETYQIKHPPAWCYR
jgi:hypothetical protein